MDSIWLCSREQCNRLHCNRKQCSSALQHCIPLPLSPSPTICSSYMRSCGNSLVKQVDLWRYNLTANPLIDEQTETKSNRKVCFFRWIESLHLIFLYSCSILTIGSAHNIAQKWQGISASLNRQKLGSCWLSTQHHLLLKHCAAMHICCISNSAATKLRRLTLCGFIHASHLKTAGDSDIDHTGRVKPSNRSPNSIGSIRDRYKWDDY